MQKDGGQLFNYYNSYRQAKWLCLYASDFVNEQAESIYHLISMSDNPEYLVSDNKLLSFEVVQAENGSKSDYFRVWSDIYQQDFFGLRMEYGKRQRGHQIFNYAIGRQYRQRRRSIATFTRH